MSQSWGSQASAPNVGEAEGPDRALLSSGPVGIHKFMDTQSTENQPSLYVTPGANDKFRAGPSSGLLEVAIAEGVALSGAQQT